MKISTLKKVISCVMAVSTLFALAACSSNETSSQTQTSSQRQETSVAESSTSAELTDPQAEATTPIDDVSSSTLVVYYSATGNTESVANTIAVATGGDLFELEPTEPYSDEDLDWTNESSRVSVEHDNPDARTVELTAETVDNWDNYDTVYIGYPIWWGIAAWPVDTFVNANDFTGKTIIPFCTSSSLGLGESGKLLAEKAGTGEWLEGQRFRSGASESDIINWVNSLEPNQ
ncbi:flavodoxin [Clostridium sp. KNHs205]|uniref:flavodoxin n=1 Tax=Clostridium sp. KNHs205 TaxID=1449050 RepID=UPI00051B85FE|nr:flavodoxin [Clostridium sp. KNHs205]